VHRLSRRPGFPPYFVLPHGMLDPTLRRTYPVKHVKKWIYWSLVERRVLRDARAVFFTCEEERRLARGTFPFFRCNERVVAYGTSAPTELSRDSQIPWVQRCPAVAAKNYFLFLGRIHSKKGVHLLVRAYARLARAGTGRAVPDLVLAGPSIDQSFLNGLKAEIGARGLAERIHWTGMLTGDAKWAALKRADAFILPSYQENFGIAVAEALSVGTPVLLSDRVNIWRELVEDGAALVEPPTEAGTMQLMARWLDLEEDARRQMSDAAKRSFQARFEVSHAAQNLASELSSLIRTTKSNG
jgi:glycosyltransferase involved in cell wall biosynthesis